MCMNVQTASHFWNIFSNNMTLYNDAAEVTAHLAPVFYFLGSVCDLKTKRIKYNDVANCQIKVG